MLQHSVRARWPTWILTKSWKPAARKRDVLLRLSLFALIKSILIALSNSRNHAAKRAWIIQQRINTFCRGSGVNPSTTKWFVRTPADSLHSFHCLKTARRNGEQKKPRQNLDNNLRHNLHPLCLSVYHSVFFFYFDGKPGCTI